MRARVASVLDARPTSIVLWLMILVVFVPIAGMHGLARLLDDGAAPPLAQHAASVTKLAR